MKLDEQSSYLTTYSCPFGRYWCKRLPFGVASFTQRKIGELFHGLHNVFGIADDILIAGFDDFGRHHNEIVDKVLEICRKANLKDKCHFSTGGYAMPYHKTELQSTI